MIRRHSGPRSTVETRYVLEPGENDAFRGFSCRWINRDDQYPYLGISFDEWEQYADRTIAHAELKGSGEGMIGGPTKTQVGIAPKGEVSYWCYDGPFDGSHLLEATWRAKTCGRSLDIEQKVREAIEKWSQLLQDESYEFSLYRRQSMQRMIEKGQKFLHEQE